MRRLYKFESIRTCHLHPAMAGYIYLIHTPEHMRENIPIYKIGRTLQEDLGRFKDYPKGSKLLLHTETADHARIETELIAKFNEQFTLVKGREWFLGDRNLMIDIINEHIRLARSRPQPKPTNAREPAKNAPKSMQTAKIAQSFDSHQISFKIDARMANTIDNITKHFGNLVDDDIVF